MGLLLILLLGCTASARAGIYEQSGLSQAPQQAEEPAPVFRTGTTWVRVDAQVWDRNRVINDLTKDDFVIYDEDQPQPIRYFGHEAEPLDVLLLLDVSGSMTRYLEQVASTAREALRQLNTGDRVGVMLFARRAQVHEELTEDRGKVEQELRDAVREKRLGSGTLINSAIITAAEYLKKHPATQEESGPKSGRRAVLIMTDNLGLNYQTPDEQVVEALFSADAVLNAIVVGRGERPEQPKPGQYVNPDFTPPDVFRLADDTGGVALKTERADATFRWIIESIRSRYSLQYRAPEQAQAGTFRRIRVELSPAMRKKYPKAIVRARTGYHVTQ